jgi:mono/diheme cytochrome c family protein
MNEMRAAAAIALSACLLACAAARADADASAALYQRCVTCHQPGGEGIPGIFPPLRNRLAGMIGSGAGREYVIMVLSNGLVGTIAIDGQRYVGAMPAQGLSDEEAAQVINYVATAFAEPGAMEGVRPLTGAEVAAVRTANQGDAAQSALNLRSRVPALQQ